MSDHLHILLVTFPAWGHIRPLCALGSRLAAAQPNVLVTIFTTAAFYEKICAEVEGHFLTDKDGCYSHIRVVSIVEATAIRPSELVGRFGEAYPAAYERLFRGEEVICTRTGIVGGTIPPPRAIIMDFFSVMQLHQTRAISGPCVPIFTLASCSTAALVRLFGPEEIGGLGDFGARTDAEALRTGKVNRQRRLEIRYIFKHTDGSVIRLPGIPPMYDYEFFPQTLPWDIPMAPIVRAGHEMFTRCDGVLINTCRAYGSETLDALESWVVSSLEKPLFPVGPLLPATHGRDADCENFLDNALATSGPRSVVLISFGTLFWPRDTAHLEQLVDTLIEMNFHFILAHASFAARVPHSLTERIAASPLGMSTAWCPQQLILTHAATGWFVTHGGHGGITESLSAGVPMIVWPFDGDQPTAAVLLSQVLDVAFHLIEIRSGENGMRPMYSGQQPSGAVKEEFARVLAAAREGEGLRKWENARKLATQFRLAWTEQGEATKTIASFLRKISL
ncbi:unnamed protein product [Mycena citricolor]|uniref:Glycosyltransferase family 1 protein n=1 Tax=Mycena citricolor TaxID=2018698 RepID=A0AAD2Q5S6_9AGAR|nr:unnamed protein product [Mycena citricolor]